MRLHSYYRSSSAWRVRIVLNLKKVEHQIVPVDLSPGVSEQLGAAFLSQNPQGQVPVLELDDGALLTQSVAIVEYLEERFPEPPLLPRAPEDRARVRKLVEIVSSGIQPYQNLSLRRELATLGIENPEKLVQGYIRRGLEVLETEAPSTSGAFLAGDQVTLADAFLVPQLYASRRFGVATDPYPTLLRVERACEILPAFQAAHPSAQPDARPDP